MNEYMQINFCLFQNCACMLGVYPKLLVSMSLARADYSSCPRPDFQILVLNDLEYWLPTCVKHFLSFLDNFSGRKMDRSI